MKYFLSFLFFLFLSLQSFAQFQSNNLEQEENMPITIGPNTQDSIWQIGEPNKLLFDSAYSAPFVIVTDTINAYGPNLKSSFTLEINEFNTYAFPYIQLEWTQQTDMEEGVDGGVIELSYDEGNTWSNIFDDPVFRPDIVGNYHWDTLHNGQAGITGTDEWNWMAICWGSNTGTLPDNPTTIQVRFTFVSDSIDTNQDGWMIDDFLIQGNIIGNNTNIKEASPIAVFPNPVKEILTLDLVDLTGVEAKVEMLDHAGKKVLSTIIEVNGRNHHQMDLSFLPAGVYYLSLQNEQRYYQQKFLKIE